MNAFTWPGRWSTGSTQHSALQCPFAAARRVAAESVMEREEGWRGMAWLVPEQLGGVPGMTILLPSWAPHGKHQCEAHQNIAATLGGSERENADCGVGSGEWGG